MVAVMAKNANKLQILLHVRFTQLVQPKMESS